MKIHPLNLLLLVVFAITFRSVSASQPAFAEISNSADRKQAFITYLVPYIRTANDEIWAERLEVLQFQDNETLSADQKTRLLQLADKYKVARPMAIDAHFYKALLRRVDVVPAALVLAQAANESGWGTSRFAVEGHNYFGLWCYSPGCGFTPKRRVSGARHEVRRFDNVGDGIRGYLLNLNSQAAFRGLHERRETSRNSGRNLVSVELAGGLGRYSERREAYVSEIRAMIAQNELHQYTLSRNPIINE